MLMHELHPTFGPDEVFDVVTLLTEAPPISWRPRDPGDFVEGVVTRMLDGRRKTYMFPILEVRPDTGALVRIRASAVTLRNKIQDLGICPGSRIRIEFKGSKTSQAGYEYRLFDVKVI